MPTIILNNSKERTKYLEPQKHLTEVGTGSNKKKVILSGPFIGDPRWECLYFCGHVLYLVTTENLGLVVCTRPDRFDLYGQYADILVPLRFQESESLFNGFADESVSSSRYHVYAKKFASYYQKKFNVVKHIYPEVSGFSSLVKWQFPRHQVNYSFRPRKKCYRKVRHLLEDTNVFVSSGYEFMSNQFNVITPNDLNFDFDLTFSYLGCLIEVLKRSTFSICDISSVEAQLSLLVSVPVVSTKVISEEQLQLINPKDTLVIICENVDEGVKYLLDRLNKKKSNWSNSFRRTTKK